MANAKFDQNNIPTILGLSSSDGTTTINPTATPGTHVLDVSDGTTGSDLSGDQALRDQNYNVCMLGVSNADGITPVPIYITAGGSLLIKST